MLWHFAPFLASCREGKPPRGCSATVTTFCYILGTVVIAFATAFFVALLGSIEANGLLYLACFAGLFVGFILFLRHVCKRTKRQLPSGEKATCPMVDIDRFLGFVAIAAWCCIVVFGVALINYLEIRVAAIESMAFISAISIILSYLFVPDMGKMATRELLTPFVKRRGSTKVALIPLAMLVSFFALWVGWNGLAEEQVVKNRETGEFFIIKAEYAGNDCVAAPAVCGDDGSYSAKDEGVFTKINLMDGYETVQD